MSGSRRDWGRIRVGGRSTPDLTSPFDNPLTAYDPFPSTRPDVTASSSRSTHDPDQEKPTLQISGELADFAATLENPIPDRKVVDLGQLDAAMEFMVGQQRTDVTAEEYRRVRRKSEWHRGQRSYQIDLRLVPILMIVYFLQQLDKSVLSFASPFGLSTDLNLQGTDYSWLGSILYFAQLFFQLREWRVFSRRSPQSPSGHWSNSPSTGGSVAASLHGPSSSSSRRPQPTPRACSSLGSSLAAPSGSMR